MRRRKNDDELYERTYQVYGTHLVDRMREWDEDTALGWQKWLYVRGALSIEHMEWRVEDVLRARRRYA